MNTPTAGKHTGPAAAADAFPAGAVEFVSGVAESNVELLMRVPLAYVHLRTVTEMDTLERRAVPSVRLYSTE